MNAQMNLALHLFARAEPRMKTYTIDWGRDALTVYYTTMEVWTFSIREVLARKGAA